MNITNKPRHEPDPQRLDREEQDLADATALDVRDDHEDSEILRTITTRLVSADWRRA